MATDGVRQLGPLGRKELDPIVVIGLWDAEMTMFSLQAQGAGQVGDRRSRQGPDQRDVDAGCGKPASRAASSI